MILVQSTLVAYVAASQIRRFTTIIFAWFLRKSSELPAGKKSKNQPENLVIGNTEATLFRLELKI